MSPFGKINPKVSVSQKAFGGLLQPRINRNSNADTTTDTKSDPAHPSRFEKKANTTIRSSFAIPFAAMSMFGPSLITGAKVQSSGVG
jgi:hypothetical protein